jgi:hypothetical protein
VWRLIATDEWIDVTLVVDTCQVVHLFVSLHLGEKWRFMTNQGDVSACSGMPQDHRILAKALA